MRRDQWVPALGATGAPAAAPTLRPLMARPGAPANGTARVPAHAAPVVRRLRPGDDAVIRQLFRATVCMGQPLPFVVPGWDDYESLCLDWYLGPGRADGAVLMDNGNITGYVLVCTDSEGHHRWQRHQAAVFTARSVTRLLAGRLNSDASRFLRLRLRDGWEMWRHGIAPPWPAHAHINLAVPARGRGAARQVTEHVDQRCQRAGLPGWFGEINAIAGRRRRALERVGLPVVHRAPNHTLSWLLDQPVERLTVARRLAPVGSDGLIAPTAVVA